jgi:hypothetical protein
VIHSPLDEEERQWCKDQFAAYQIDLSPLAHYLTWLRDGAPVWYVAYDGFVGSTCQMHVIGAQAYPPRKMAFAAFNYAFTMIGRKMVFGVVNSNNPHVLRFDLWLGFKEFARFPGVHDGEGDLVLLKMDENDWKERYGRRRQGVNSPTC